MVDLEARHVRHVQAVCRLNLPSLTRQLFMEMTCVVLDVASNGLRVWMSRRLVWPKASANEGDRSEAADVRWRLRLLRRGLPAYLPTIEVDLQAKLPRAQPKLPFHLRHLWLTCTSHSRKV